MQELVAELREPDARERRPELVDAVLEHVDLAVDRVEEVEVRVGDVVDQALDEDADRHARLGRGRQHGRLVRRPVARRLAHGHEQLRRRDEGDLLTGDAVIGQRQHRDQHPEDVGAVTLDHRPWLAVLGRRCCEGLDDGRVDVDGERRVQLLAGRVDEIEPARGHEPRA